MKAIGVIIQGPLVTYGQGPGACKQGRNASEDIAQNLSNISKHGFKYIVSTWSPKSEREQSCFDKVRNITNHIVDSSPPTGFDPQHIYKHHFGIYKGYEKLVLDDASLKFFVKIRSDMIMPDRFWEWIKAISDDHKKMYISELCYFPFYLGDFIYAGCKPVFVEFLNATLDIKSKTLHPAAVVDIGMKYYQYKNNFYFSSKKYQGIKTFYFWVFKKKWLMREWDSFLKSNIGVLDKKIWERIIWRGKVMESFLDSSIFEFDPLDKKKNSFINSIFDYLHYMSIYLRTCNKHLFLSFLFNWFCRLRNKLLRIFSTMVNDLKKRHS